MFSSVGEGTGSGTWCLHQILEVSDTEVNIHKWKKHQNIFLLLNAHFLCHFSVHFKNFYYIRYRVSYLKSKYIYILAVIQFSLEVKL